MIVRSSGRRRGSATFDAALAYAPIGPSHPTSLLLTWHLDNRIWHGNHWTRRCAGRLIDSGKRDEIGSRCRLRWRRMSHQRRDWDEISRLDPLWAILSDPARRHGRWDVEEFLATGRSEIDGALQNASRWGLPRKLGRALDFGCGVGRLTKALAAHFETAVGVDISANMVSRARALHADDAGCTFRVLDHRGLTVFPERTFDCVYSRIVLQHVPDRASVTAYLQDFVRLLDDKGLLVFQMPASIPLRRRMQLRPKLYGTLRRLGVAEGLLYQQLGLHPIRMRAVPEAEVLRLITSAGARVIAIDRTEMGDSGIQDRTYWATRDL